MTHCHSSTAVEVIKGIAKGKKSFDAVCTETRPLFQGRITAKSLLDAGISATLIADSSAESFVIGRGSVPIDAVFIGCDQITMDLLQFLPLVVLNLLKTQAFFLFLLVF